MHAATTVSNLDPASSDLARARSGATKVLTHCLGLQDGDLFCLVSDESTSAVAELLLKQAEALRLSTRSFIVPLDVQRRFSVGIDVGSDLATALQEARGIVTCLSDDTGGTEFRREMLRLGVNDGTRVGHMPGANLSLLATAADINYLEAAERCEQLAYAMDVGQQAELVTYEFSLAGEVTAIHTLHLDLGGCNRYPITSTGIIASNTWGNIPGGETFIAPMEELGEGCFVLNGSLKGKVCTLGDQVVLHFERGKLTKVIGSADLRTYLLRMITPALRLGDPFADCIAELGVGVNLGIHSLTGTALIDEKCAGTAHIALGDNARYGGWHESKVHEDLITLAPSLSIDGKVLLERGEYRFDPQQWFTPLRKLVVRNEFLDPGLRVRKRSTVSVDTSDGLRVIRNVGSGRRARYPISAFEDMATLAAIYDVLPYFPHSVDFAHIEASLGWTLGETGNPLLPAVLQTLHDHALIMVLSEEVG